MISGSARATTYLMPNALYILGSDSILVRADRGLPRKPSDIGSNASSSPRNGIQIGAGRPQAELEQLCRTRRHRPYVVETEVDWRRIAPLHQNRVRTNSVATPIANIVAFNNQLKAAGVSQPLFDDTARQALYQATKGIPRKVNKLALTALRLAAARKEATVGEAILLDATTEALL